MAQEQVQETVFLNEQGVRELQTRDLFYLNKHSQ